MRPLRTPAVEVVETETGLTVHHHETGAHHLNGTASIIYVLCDGTRQVEELAADVGAQYDNRFPLLEVKACLEDLLSRGLVELLDATTPGSPHDGHEDGAPPSLFIVSLPRSASGRAYMSACRLLGLRRPSWTTEGEILNFDRFSGHRSPASFDRFVTRENRPLRFLELVEYLETAARPKRHAYKDVLQPFVVSAWLRGSEFRVLRIHRDVPEVACSMLRWGWTYPAAAVDPQSSPMLDRRLDPFEPDGSGMSKAETLVRGLLLAEHALDGLGAPGVAFEDVLPGSSGLAHALLELYPGTGQRPLPEADPGEVANSLGVWRDLRNSEDCRRLRDLVERCRQSPQPASGEQSRA